MAPILKLFTPGELILTRPQLTSPLGIIGWLSFAAAALSLVFAAALSALIYVFFH
jgi:ABC-type Na+ efflux pump permease subunit